MQLKVKYNKRKARQDCAKISMLKVKYYFQFIRKLFSITKGVCL
jgi:hypothetical protein